MTYKDYVEVIKKEHIDGSSFRTVDHTNGQDNESFDVVGSLRWVTNPEGDRYRLWTYHVYNPGERPISGYGGVLDD